jgi:uncharacterized protein (TIGR02271 family)
MAKTVIGMFDEFTHAKAAVSALKDAGFRSEEISLAANDAAGEHGKVVDADRNGSAVGNGAMTGAGVGAAIGGGTGLVLGLLGVSMIAVPGIGPILAAGPIAAALAGAGVGAVAGGLIGALTKLGVDEEHAHTYAEGVRRGSTLVTVRCEDAEAQRAADILDRHHAVDVEQRAAFWRKQGWQRHDHKAAPYTREQIAKERAEYAKIPVVQEEIAVGKREVSRGGVRVFTHVSETPVQQSVDLRQEKVSVQRKPVDRPASSQDVAGMKDQTVEVRARSEEAVVAKSARVVEEVVVRKDATSRTEQVQDTVKRTDVQVQDLGPSGRAGSGFEANWRSNYNARFANSGMTYEAMAPAYRHGHDACSDARYRGKDWKTVEPELRRSWEANKGATAWEKVKDAAQHAWNGARKAMGDLTGDDRSSRERVSTV